MPGELPDSGEPGVYQLIDIDNNVAYIGESGGMRRRLSEHIKRFTSTIAGQRRLDYWEIKEIRWWYDSADRSERENAEAKLLYHSPNDPYLNMETGVDNGYPIDHTSPDGTVTLLTESEVSERKNPYIRSRRKLTFLSELVDYLEWGDGDHKAHQALDYHISILQACLEELAIESKESHRYYRNNE